MAIETELKLELDPDAIQALLASDLLAENPTIVDQVSVYFDTANHDLRAAGYSLRIRKVGSKRMQTVKAPASSTQGPLVRLEWEKLVDGDEPVIDDTTPLHTALNSGLDGVAPQFEVRVERRKWNLYESRSLIEAVLDMGIIKADDRQTSICEVELELKTNDPASLFAIARKIEAAVPVRIGVLSKAERGYRLLAPIQTVVKAEPLDLEIDCKTVGSFQRIVFSCLRQFRLNETSLGKSSNAEALHQTRVALRRLRSTFAIFKPILIDDEADRIRSELKWLASVLGDARNIDVLIEGIKDSNMNQSLSRARRDAYEAVNAALCSPRARAMMLDLCAWLTCGQYLRVPRTAELREMRGSEFATIALDRLRKKLRKHGKNLAEADDEHRHEVRKDAKKLRYAGEFFRSLFYTRKSRRSHKRFAGLMDDLQDHLGSLNDMVTRRRVLKQLGIENTGERNSTEASDKVDMQNAAEVCLKDLMGAKCFWH